MFLGIDIGTSSVKVVAVDERQALVAQSSVELSVQRPQPLWSEQDPIHWWNATIAAVTALPAECRRAVQGIGLSGQMHGAVLLDAQDRVLRPAILWNDGRSEVECGELERLEPRLRQITGNLAMPGFTAPKLRWVRKHERAIFDRTTSVLLPKDYVRLRLTGDKISDMSDAAGTLWLDVGQRCWSEAMLAATGLDRTQMPGLVEGTQSAGRLRPEVATLLGLPRVGVAGGAGDNAAGAVGTGIVHAGEAILSLGTSGALFVVTDGYRAAPEHAVHSFCHAVPGTWHQMSVILSAASALDWVVSMTGFGTVGAAVEAAQAVGVGRDTPLFLPYLSGERTPHNDPNALGVFFGLSPRTGRADLVAAVLEGVALAFADGLDALTTEPGANHAISLVGGGARLGYWARILASALQRPLARYQGGEVGAAFGAARLGRLAATSENFLEVCAAPPIDDVTLPDPSLTDAIKSRQSTFRQLYHELKPAFRKFRSAADGLR